MRRFFAFCLASLIAVTTSAWAGTDPLVEAAFARANGSGGGWAYTRTHEANGTASVERFDPATGNGGWTLIEIDGKPPSRKKLRKYAASGVRRESRDHPGEVDLHDIVDVATVVLVEETETLATYRFKPTPDEADDTDSSAFLEGTMVIDKSGPFAETLELANIEPFAPAGGVKISRMRVTMKFTVLDDGARIAMRALSQSMEGRLLGIKRISESSTTIFSDFGSQN